MELSEMEAIRLMALWVYRPEHRQPSDLIASPETLFRMADGFARPDSEFREFAYGMKAAIEARISQYGGPML